MRTEVPARLAARLALVVLGVGLLAAHAAPGSIEPTDGGRAEIVVGPGGDVATITEALSLAGDGDRIRILPGTYREGTLVVERSVTLVGDGYPVLDGEGARSVLIVTADGVELRRLLFRGAGVSHVRDHAAIIVEGARDCVIEDNRFEDNFFGIYLARATSCRVTGNRVVGSAVRETSAGNGIHLWNAEDVVVNDNVVTGHRDGIYLEFARGAVIRGNVSADNLRYGLHFMFSDASVYEGNAFRRNGAGVAVMYSSGVRMSGNDFEDNWGPAAYGLLLKEVRDSEVAGNTFRRNTTAIFSEGSDRVTFRRNRITRNGWAVKILASSQENAFIENDFIENTFDVTTNSRRNYNTFDGNHWSRYAGYDLSGDGVGDVPHRPVRLFALLVERRPAALVLLRSFFMDLLELAERVLPVLTPETLVDENPKMREVAR